jgi:hypothetical protein
VSDFRLHKLVHIKAWDVTAFVGYWAEFDAAFVVFRGTDSSNIGNWIANIEVFTEPYFHLPFPGAVQQGRSRPRRNCRSAHMEPTCNPCAVVFVHAAMMCIAHRRRLRAPSQSHVSGPQA